jgi:glutathione synthase
VSVVYFRAGYAPSDYFGEDEWAARALIERSAAIKCPTLGYQLAGTKKVSHDTRPFLVGYDTIPAA